MKGLLIDYEYCYGCEVCEMACKTEHGYTGDVRGIQLTQIGPRRIGEDRWEFTFVPVVTDFCDLCEERTAMGKLPTCVHHCNAKVIEYGPIEELQEKLKSKSKVVVYSIDPQEDV